MMTVEWKPLVYRLSDGREWDLSSYYQVSNTGLIWNNFRKALTGTLNKNINPGTKFNQYRVFRAIVEREDGTKGMKYLRVHRAVACAFVDGYHIAYDIDHKDEDIYNNHYSNLQWLPMEEHRGKVVIDR